MTTHHRALTLRGLSASRKFPESLQECTSLLDDVRLIAFALRGCAGPTWKITAEFVSDGITTLSRQLITAYESRQLESCTVVAELLRAFAADLAAGLETECAPTKVAEMADFVSVGLGTLVWALSQLPMFPRVAHYRRRRGRS